MGAVPKNGSDTIESAIENIRQSLADKGERFMPPKKPPSVPSNDFNGPVTSEDSAKILGLKRIISAGSARPKQDKKLTLLRNDAPTKQETPVAYLESSIDYFPLHDLSPEPAIDVPRQMPVLLDHHALQMSEKAAWAEMKRVMRGAQSNNACRGQVCFGPAIPEHLVVNNGPPLGSSVPVQASLAAGPLASPNLRQRPLLCADAEPVGSFDGPSSVDDTTSELLRPLLRQWLEENMARMLQKALQLDR
jgi:hypothetical protein